MKTNSFFAALMAVAVMVGFTSCGDPEGPEVWADEIEDFYRLEATSTCFAIVYMDVEGVHEFADKLDSLAQDFSEKSKDRHAPVYKLALEEMAKDYEAAEDMLKVYNALPVEFGEWTKGEINDDGDQVWTAIEKNSGNKMIFTNNYMNDWDANIDEDSEEENIDFYDPYIKMLLEDLEEED